MASPSKRIIAVIGATGTQGGSVTWTFLSLPNWHVRCLTRNPASEAAQALASLGAEVVQADLGDLSSLSRAFSNANAIFLNTDFWTVFRPTMASGKNEVESGKLAYEAEVTNGKNAAIAAAGVSTLERLVYSALGPMEKASNGKFKTYHWAGKSSIVEYIENEQPELAKKSSIIYLGAYNTNPFVAPKRNPQTGEYGFVLPFSKETRFPIVDPIEATGPFVRALVEDEAPGTKLLAYNESSYLDFGSVVDIWTGVTGKNISFVQTTAEALHAMTGIPLEILLGGAYLGEFDYCAGVEGIIEPHQLKNKVQTKSFEQWLKEGGLKNMNI
ncbi:NAD(P)-binding protein [Coniochaeta ligniaria NRRL 30616]|uniref:NAD(P)-binding protein n=1 Tax=Coniochaeta ligniaria NRRL 30616 TaxID=1408157 RepID=A0A1J7I5R1_9PEZI|nr:NAD(P)-binding protein [Coniochaeta ligniaria NRRL 30616]